MSQKKIETSELEKVSLDEKVSLCNHCSKIEIECNCKNECKHCYMKFCDKKCLCSTHASECI